MKGAKGAKESWLLGEAKTAGQASWKLGQKVQASRMKGGSKVHTNQKLHGEE